MSANLIILKGKLLLRRISTAVNETAEMKWAFEQFSSALNHEEVEGWTQKVEDWERGASNENPYEICTTGSLQLSPSFELTNALSAPTQASVRKFLAEEEAALVRRDASFIIRDGESPSIMVNAGIDLEDQQYVYYHYHCY
jgi:hypothetical protein